MATALIAMKFKKRPKPELEGPPEREEEHGAGHDEEPGVEVEEHEDAGPESGEMPGGAHDDHAAMALDELADIAGVAPADREDFGAAMTAFVHASIAKVMSEQDEPPPDEGEEPEQPEAEEPAPEET
jgi:hypothetical protein